MQTYMITLYKRLLADISFKSEVSLDAPEEISTEWALIEGPKLDKNVLRYLEGLDDNVIFPEWLKPLWDRFILTDNPIFLKYLRQILVFCYKAEQQPTNEQLQQAQKAFEETDAMCHTWDANFVSHPISWHLRTARAIVGSVIYRINWKEIIPSHGPGGTFPTRLPCDKSNFLTIYNTIQCKYPSDQYYCGLPSFWVDYFCAANGSLTESDDIISNLVAVPKDSRGPRLISVHPAEAIWIQQGQRRLLESAITQSHRTRGRINFTDQTVNGKLCLESSLSRKFCTIDLKDASDRISSSLVRYLFGSYAYDWISCARSNKIKLMDGRVITLQKFAPMGNALCFPVESLVFYSLVVAGIRSRYGINCNDVYVFGDDILCPTEYYEGAIQGLISAGLVPNPDKCFVKGFFRESCGVDAYKGIDVTPLRCRKSDITTIDGIVSNLSLAQRLRQAGYESSACFAYKTIRKQLWHSFGINLPITNDPETGFLVEYQNIPYTELVLRENVRYLTKYQRTAVRACLVTSPQLVVRNGEWYHLQDSLLRLERKFKFQDECSTWSPSAKADRPTEYPIPYRARLKYGWAGCRVTSC